MSHPATPNRLPASNRHERDMEATLAQCTHFVQLLDDNYALGIPHNQHFTAEGTELPILQWRDPSLNTASIDNPEQKELLEGAKVHAIELSDFIRQVRQAAAPPEDPHDSPASIATHSGKPERGQTVFVHASPDDFEHAHQVAQNLKNQGWGIVLPRYSGDAAKIRKNIERGYQHCDILLVLQRQASADVVEDYLSDAQIHAQNAPVLICQDSGAEELFFIPHNVQTLACNSHFEDDCLEQFLAEVDA